MAQPAAKAVADTVLTVQAGGAWFALKLADIHEIIRPLPLTPVPLSPRSLLGLANLRGRALPVISLAALLGHAASTVNAATRIVIVTHNEDRVGLLVEALSPHREASEAAPLDLGHVLAGEFGGRSAATARVPQAGAGATAVTLSQKSAAAAQDVVVLAVFSVGGGLYALRIADLREIVAYPEDIARPAGTDPAVLGLATLHQAVVPLVCLRALLGVPDTRVDRSRARVLVTTIGTLLVGLVVDDMQGVRRLPVTSLDAVSPVLTRGAGESRIEAICRLPDGGGLVGLLSPGALFDAATTARLEGLNATSRPRGPEVQAAATVENLLEFVISGQSFGLPAAVVEEVARCPTVLTALPHAPAFVSGLMNLRGSTLPVIDQRARLAEASGIAGGVAVNETLPQRGLVVILRVQGTRFALRVQGVRRMRAVPAEELHPVPKAVAAREALFDRVTGGGVGGPMMLVIDPVALLNGTARALSAVADAAPRHLRA